MLLCMYAYITIYRCCNLKETYGRGFCLSPILLLLFYLNGCCAYSHVHTKRSFHEISRLYDNKYNTSNYYIDAYVKTYTHHSRGSSYIYQAWATTSFLFHSPLPLFYETHPFPVFFLLETQNSSSFIIYHVTKCFHGRR